MMQTDVKSAIATSSGPIVDYRTRIKGIAISYLADGDVKIYDSATTVTVGTSLTPVFRYAENSTPGSIYIPVPGEGILCTEGIYVLSNGASVTVFYG